MAVPRLNFKPAATAFVVLLGALPAKANDVADTLLQALPPALEGWSLQTGRKDMDAGGVKAFGMYSSTTENRLFVVEVDAGGQIVETNAAAWDHQMLISETVEIESVPFLIGSDGLTALIDKSILIRAYGPEADERDVIKSHMVGLNVEALEALAAQFK